MEKLDMSEVDMSFEHSQKAEKVLEEKIEQSMSEKQY
jgi:hypothetical protein